MNALRKQMEADLAIRGLAYRTREAYVEAVAKLAKFYGRRKVYELPPAQDQEIALTKLSTMGIGIDKLTDEQVKYATDYSAGT